MDGVDWFGYTLFYFHDYPPSTQFTMFALIHITVNRFLQVTASVYPLMNLLLYVDLYWIMRDPFYPQKKRNNLYITSIILFSVITFFYQLIILSTNLSSDSYHLLYPIFGLIVNGSFGLLSFILIIAILVRLSRKGTSPKLRQIIIIRYFILYVVFLGQYLNMFMKFMAEIQKKRELQSKVLLKVELYSMVLIPVIRISEPLILHSLKRSVQENCLLKHCFRKTKTKKGKYLDDSLFAFLNSQFNVEYVYLILEGITSLLRGEDIKREKLDLLQGTENLVPVAHERIRLSMQESDRKIVSIENGTTCMKLKNVTIRNINQWQVDNVIEDYQDNAINEDNNALGDMDRNIGH